MRLAIFHNYMDNIGGAEMVGLILANEMNADIYTTNVDKEKIEKMGFSTERIASIGKVPKNAPFRQQLALNSFRRFKTDMKYDLHIIEGDWAVSGAIRHKPNMWYVHSPIREIWDLYEFTRKNSVPPIQRPIFDIWVTYNRHLNLKYVKHVNKIICNSNTTKNRVKKYLKRDAIVINPPVVTSDFNYRKNGDFWLSVNRLIYHKRVEIQMKAFSKMPDEKLVVVGCFEKSKHFNEYKNYIMDIKPPNVEIVNFIDRKRMIEYYSNCKGFITTSKDEDFGLTPVEAMASGKPVIAPNEGGYRETVVDGKTGLLIDNIDDEKLIRAVNEIGKDPKRYKNDCLARSKLFDYTVFVKKMKEVIDH